MIKNTSKVKTENTLTIKALEEAQNSLDNILSKFQSSLSGLTQENAKSRLEQYGKNEVAREKVPSAFVQLLLDRKSVV